jgi:hypothetical protein
MSWHLLDIDEYQAVLTECGQVYREIVGREATPVAPYLSTLPIGRLIVATSFGFKNITFHGPRR